MSIIVGNKGGIRFGSDDGGGTPPVSDFWFDYDSVQDVDLVSGETPTTMAGVRTWPLSSLPETQIGLQGTGGNPAIGELQVYFTTNYSFGGFSGSAGFVTASAQDTSFLYIQGILNRLNFLDGTNTSFTIIIAQVGQDFRLRAVHGNITELGGTMMVIVLDTLDASGNITSTALGPTVAFDGEFPVSAVSPLFEIGRGAPNITVDNVRWYKTPTQQTLDLFMVSGFQYELQAELG